MVSILVIISYVYMEVETIFCTVETFKFFSFFRKLKSRKKLQFFFIYLGIMLPSSWMWFTNHTKPTHPNKFSICKEEKFNSTKKVHGYYDAIF